jgi:hypothetical protein
LLVQPHTPRTHCSEPAHCDVTRHDPPKPTPPANAGPAKPSSAINKKPAATIARMVTSEVTRPSVYSEPLCAGTPAREWCPKGMLPPGPRGALWQTLGYMRDPVGWLVARAKKYGDPFMVPTLVRPLVLTANTDGVRAIFGADPDTFSPFAGEMGVQLLGRGSMLLQWGQPHRRARKLTQPPFHGARMRSYELNAATKSPPSP